MLHILVSLIDTAMNRNTPDCYYQAEDGKYLAEILPTMTARSKITNQGSQWEVKKDTFQPGKAYPFRTEEGIVMMIPRPKNRKLISCLFGVAIGAIAVVSLVDF